MKEINNCDELLAYLFETYDDTKYACGGHIMFQGDICEIGGAMPDRWCSLIPSCKCPRTVFAIDNHDENGQFNLYIFKGGSFVLDETLAVKLLNYVKDELIATLKGEW